MNRFFDVWFPKIFIGMFVIAGLLAVLQIVIFVSAGFWLLTDPHAASTIGNHVGEVVRPIADAVKGD